MKNKVIKYWRIRASKTLHLDVVAHLCHYFGRRTITLNSPKLTTIKRRTDRVCDECQRQKRLLRKKK